MIEELFLQLSLLLGLTLLIGFIAKMLRQPFLVAYIAAGICAGPLLLNLLDREQPLYHLFSQFGVVLLLFMVGLSLDFNYLKKIGRVALFTGLGQILIGGPLTMLLLHFLGFAFLPSFYLATAMTFASTIITTKLLADKHDTESLYGRQTIALLLVQDVIAIIIMLVLTALKEGGELSTALLPLIPKGIILVSFIFFLAKFFLPWLLKHIAVSSEFLFLFTIAWCFGMASLVTVLGFSIEIGAIVAGLSLGSSPYQSEISSRIKPLRDFFLILFFVLLGSETNLASLSTILKPGVVMIVFVLFTGPLVLYFLFRLMKFTRRNSFLSALSGAQVSEFGFVLLFVGRELGHVGDRELALFTLVALTTIFISSYLITYNKQIEELMTPWFKLFKRDRLNQKEERAPEYDVWIIGYHRIGWRICQALRERKASFAVVDFNPETIDSLRQAGIPAYFGDVDDVEFLATIPLHKAKLIISTIPDAVDQITLLKHLRAHRTKPFVVTNLVDPNFRQALYHSGADYVMMPHLLGGGWIAELIKKQHLSKKIFQKLRREQEEEVKLGLGKQFFAPE